MQRIALIIGLTLGISLFFGCTGGKQSPVAETESSSPTPSSEPTISTPPAPVFVTERPESFDAIFKDPATYRLGSSAMFPFIYQGPGNSHLMEAYSMRFSLAYPEQFQPRLNQQVGWVDPTKFNENNGLFLTYIQDGKELSLNNPYVQVQYLNKSLPYVSTIDSIYLWMDMINLQAADASILEAENTITTASGRPARIKDYYTGSIEKRTPRYVSYAYVDYDDSYILGLGLTTISQSDYNFNRQAFIDLVKSFQLH